MNVGPARVVSVAVLLVLLAALAVALVLGGKVSLPAAVALSPAAGTLLGLIALALVFSTARDPRPGQHFALAATVLGIAAISTWAVTTLAGAPPAGEAATGLQRVSLAVLSQRPPPLAAAGLVLLAAMLWRLDLASDRLDAAAVLGSLAAAALFLDLLGQAYGATGLTGADLRPAAAWSPLASVLLLALSVAALGLHSGGPLAAYTGNDPGVLAKRRLLPAAVLTPVLSGVVLLLALRDPRMPAPLAIALTVFANVLVMLWLVHRAGEKVAKVTEARQEQVMKRAERVKRQAQRDAMTGMLNRRGWDEETRAIEKRCRSEGIDAAVIVIDLDGLKAVNDSEGHKAGDAYIQRAAGALRRAARRRDVLARMGGDEFAYLVVGCDEEGAQAVVDRLDASLRQSRVQASVGYAMRGKDSIGAAFEAADAEMYADKRERKRRRA